MAGFTNNSGFFLWQIVTIAINIFLLASFLWRRLPRGDNKAVFQKHLLAGIWRFAAGMSGITVMGLILSQMDKVILSKTLTMEMFDYYTLAYGWTRLTLYVNSISVILLVPLIFYMTTHYGALGGASVWGILNSSYILFLCISYINVYCHMKNGGGIGRM